MIDIEIDKLTNSIEERLTGKTFDTLVKRARRTDIKGIGANWNFDWLGELASWEVYSLTVPDLGRDIQGLMSLERREDHVYVNLLESHPQNVGRGKVFEGVAGNLMAFACKLSLELGHAGCVAFEAKTELIEHYREKFGAQRIGRSQMMFIDDEPAAVLIQQYFGDQHGTHS